MLGFLCRWFPHRWTQWFTIQYPPGTDTQIRHCVRCADYETR